MGTSSDTFSLRSAARYTAGVALVMAVAAGLVAAMAGWLNHSSTILLTYAQDGLAWCF